jgi:hypothetical protein
MANFNRSQWEGALSDLKDVAHDYGVAPEQTDAWSVRHVGPNGRSEFGYYTDDGFRVIAVLESPDALRDLRRLFEGLGVAQQRQDNWTNVTLGDRVVGYVYPRTTSGPTKWGAVVEKDGRTGSPIGHADSKTEAVEMVKTAYLKS